MSKAKKTDDIEELVITEDGEVVTGKNIKNLIVRGNYVTMVECRIGKHTSYGVGLKLIDCKIGEW